MTLTWCSRAVGVHVCAAELSSRPREGLPALMLCLFWDTLLTPSGPPQHGSTAVSIHTRRIGVSNSQGTWRTLQGMLAPKQVRAPRIPSLMGLSPPSCFMLHAAIPPTAACCRCHCLCRRPPSASRSPHPYPDACQDRRLSSHARPHARVSVGGWSVWSLSRLDASDPIRSMCFLGECGISYNICGWLGIYI